MEVHAAGRFRSIEDVGQKTGLRRNELSTLADIGGVNAFTNERRSALWQVERAVRPAGELYRDSGFGIRDSGESRDSGDEERGTIESPIPNPESRSPLPVMDAHDRLRADYAG